MFTRCFHSENNSEYIISPKHKVNVSRSFVVTGLSDEENGCCEDQPILITASVATLKNNEPIYSCQCACGMWCTTGHTTDWEALKDYEEMTKRSKEERHNEAI